MKQAMLVIMVLLGFIALIWLYPAELISPGDLIEGHQVLSNDCMRCHVAFEGQAGMALKCQSCHEIEKIGRFTVAGQTLPRTGRVAFHLGLKSADCLSCHTDHAGAEALNATRAFSHELLTEAIRANCISCHRESKPADALHRSIQANCATCHSNTAWKPADFDHGHLTAAVRSNCLSCHREDKPADALHRSIQANCATCHSNSAWKPADFDHSRYFRFDANHPANCITCHTNPATFTTYSCYTCHEHRPAEIAREHRKEGIFDFQNCVSCHRSGDEDEAEDRWERRRGR